MITLTPPAPALAGPRRADSTISVASICHNFFFTAAAADTERVVTTAAGQQQHDGDLVLGVNEAGGAVRLHYTTAQQWRALALAANRIADWLEATA